MDRSLRLREAHRGAAGPPHPSGSHPGNERGELSPGPKPKTQSGENPRREYPLSTITPKNHEKTPPRPHHLWPQMVHFYAALPVHFSSGLDTAYKINIIYSDEDENQYFQEIRSSDNDYRVSVPHEIDKPPVNRSKKRNT